MSLSEYSIRVTTSSKIFSGTNDDVRIKITGTDRETPERQIYTPWHDDFRWGKTDSFKIKSIDLGEERGLAGSIFRVKLNHKLELVKRD